MHGAAAARSLAAAAAATAAAAAAAPMSSAALWRGLASGSGSGSSGGAARADGTATNSIHPNNGAGGGAGGGGANMAAVLRRLDVLERQVKQLAAPAHERQGGGNGSDSDDHPSTASKAFDSASNAMPSIVALINAGYLRSRVELRDRLMQSEWEQTMRPIALRRGVANFERAVADGDGQKDGRSPGVSAETLQRLYRNPEDLSPLAADPRMMMLARSTVEASLAEAHFEAYRRCADAAEKLASVVESGQRTGVSPLLGLLRRLLPWPFRA